MKTLINFMTNVAQKIRASVTKQPPWKEHFYLEHNHTAIVAKQHFLTKDHLEYDVFGTCISLGKLASIAGGTRIHLAGGRISIGDNCSIGEFVEITSSSSVTIDAGVKIDRLARIRADNIPVAVGSGSTVGQATHLWAHTGRLEIGRQNQISSNNEWIATGNGIVTSSNCDFGRNVTLDSAGGSIQINEHSGIGPNSILYGHGGLQIGRGCAIAGLTMLIPANHDFRCTGLPLRERGDRLMPITIGNDVWIGAGVAVLGNSTIGNGAVVGAGAVVVGGQVRDHEVVVGVPARAINGNSPNELKT